MAIEPFLRVIPIFVIIGIGYLVGRYLKITEDKVNFLLSITLYLFVPSLLFVSVVRVGVPEDSWIIAVAVLTIVLVTGAAAYLISNRLGIENESKKSFILGATFMNLGSMGSSIALLIYGEKAFILAMIAYVVAQFLLYTLGIIIASSDGKMRIPLKNVKQILTLPPFYALMLGMIVVSNNLVIPQEAMRILGMIGGAAVPSLLISLGLQLSIHTPKLSSLRLPLISSSLRVVGGLTIALGLISLAGNLDIVVQGVILIVGVMPTMITTLPIASKYRCNSNLLSMTITMSFIMSTVFILMIAN